MMLLGFLGVAIAFSLLSIKGNWLYSLVFFLIQWFYMAACEIASGGLTPGKRIVGLRVIMRDGTRIRPSAALLRNLIRVADQFAGIGFVSMLIVPGFRRLGDLVAGTLVVHASQRIARPIPAGAFDGVAPVAPSRPIDDESSDAALEYARRRRELGVDRADELARIGLPLYLGDEAGVSNDSGGASSVLAGIGAWCAGLRKAVPGALR
jgi:hypothetical protein